MKLRNKQTGEMVDFMIHKYVGISDDGNPLYAPFNGSIDEWEDAPEEPKNNRTWFLDFSIVPDFVSYGDNPITDPCYDDWNELGICFETKEEAERAVEKLKAWKRLEDKGFRFKKWESYEETSGLSFPDRDIVNSYTAIFDFSKPCRKYEIENEVKDDLDLLFCTKGNS